MGASRARPSAPSCTTQPLILILMGAVLGGAIQANDHHELLVGNDMGWTNYDKRSLQVPDYVAWASSHQVFLGDQIVFKYARGLHNVNLLPSKAAFDSCDFSKAKVLDSGSSGIFVWNASRVGTYYFGCNKKVEEEGNHCGSGQKLSLVVLMTTPAHASLLAADAIPLQAAVADAEPGWAFALITCVLTGLGMLLPLMHP